MKSPQHLRVEEVLQAEPQRFQILSDRAPFGMVLIDKDGTFRYINPKFKELFGYDLKDIPNGKTWFRKAYPDPTYRHHIITAWVDDLRSSKPGEKGPRVFTVICKDRTKKIINFILVQLETGENLITCEDITDRKPAEEDLLKSEEEAKRLAQENAIMAEIGRIISSTLNIEEIYERFAEEVKKLIPFDRIAMNIINPKDQTVIIAYVTGVEIEGRQTGIIVPLSGTMTEEVLRTRSTLLIQTNTRQDLAKRFPLLFPSSRANLKSFLSVPLFSKDQVIGVLHIRSTRSNAYSEKDLRLAERVGNQIAGAIANAQLYAERKQAEEALRESETKFRDLYDNAPLGYHEYDAEGRITNVNRTDLEMLGYTREELIGQPIWKLNVNEEAVREQVMAKLAGTLPPGKELERTYKRKNETIFPVLIEDRLIVDENGRIKGIRCTIQDITERKRAEETLQTERRRFQILSEYAPFGMVMIDRDGTFRYINPKFKELFGYDLKDTPNGKMWFRKAFPDPTYRHNVISAWINDSKIFAPGEKRPRVFTATCKDGTEKIVSLISVQLETGEYLMTCEDITEHMHFDEALRESEERYRTLFEGSRDAVYITTWEGRFVDFNQGFLDLFGYTREELMVLQAQDSYVHPADRYRFQKEIEKKGFVRDYEVKLRKQNGKEMDCLLNASVRRGSDGTILGYQGIIRDITERKRAEQEMKALEEQLRQSQKMEAIGRLAGGIAHDFNNILTIIQGYCQLSLCELKGDHPLRENIEGIKKSTDRAAALIRKILAFSRRQVMEMRVLDLNTLLMDLDKLLRRIIGEDIELVTVLAEDLGRVKVDPGQIEQVILNLAVNAKDAMPNGGKLTIETANAELDEVYARSHVSVAPGHHVMLSVSDTGVGMSPEVKERIFEPFYTTKEKEKGTGLGLSTVYGIVKQSGGNIWVYSEPGQGTTFKIYLPTAEATSEEITEKVVKEEPPRGGETILVVEDEEEVRKLAVQFLQKQGYKVLEATQGMEALLICEQHKESIHLLVTDVVMPGMSGRELSERLTSLRPEIKILYMSGHTNSAIFHHGVLEPGVILLQKPFTLEALARKVREVLDK
jgi:two-component system cell cycle sensor histidine kinase/response regulator CckA